MMNRIRDSVPFFHRGKRWVYEGTILTREYLYCFFLISDKIYIAYARNKVCLLAF